MTIETTTHEELVKSKSQQQAKNGKQQTWDEFLLGLIQKVKQ